jgi:beta-glucosidase-like glycosyl hydrolase
VGLGATFNQSLFHAMGEVISEEARAYFNVAEGNTNIIFWAPNINLARNLLWGRNQETPGEDPLVNGLYGQAFIERIQGGVKAIDWSVAEAAPLKGAATIKHYIAYDVECSSGGTNQGVGATSTPFDCAAPGVGRFHFEGNLSDADLNDYYLAAFKRPMVAARPASIMCSFPSVNGVPSCANGLMQNTLARDTWGFEGFIVSDCGGVNFLNQGHYLTESPPEAVAAAVKGGLDAECGIPGPWGHGNYFSTHMNETVEMKLLGESELDRSTIRVWRTAFRLGLFEPTASSPWSHLSFSDLSSPVGQQTALDAAVQSMVLLKNKDGLLPIDLTKHKTIAVVGPFQNATHDMQGGYSGTSIIIESHSPGKILAERMAAAGKGTKLLWSAGTGNGNNNTDLIPAAVAAAKQADLALLFIGDTHVSEFSDRTDNALEFAQDALLQAVCASGTPTVVVVIAGHSIELSHAKAHCDSILFALLPSQFGGDAIVDTLLGKHSPAGRLPVTFYDHSIMDTRDPLDMALRSGSGITYQHYRGEPLWEYGFGLSYTTFEFTWHEATALAASYHRAGLSSPSHSWAWLLRRLSPVTRHSKYVPHQHPWPRPPSGSRRSFWPLPRGL